MAGTEEDGYTGSAPLVATITPLKLICTVSINIEILIYASKLKKNYIVHKYFYYQDADYILNMIADSIISKVTEMKGENR